MALRRLVGRRAIADTATMRVAASLLPLLLSACASPPTSTGDDALSRFAVLLPFVPAGMQSYWFSDARGLEQNRLEPDVLQVRAGRDFEAPHLAHVGAHAFVEVSWREPTATPPGRDEYLDLEVAEPIAGTPTFFASGARTGVRNVLAFVGDGITVRASTRELLAEALQRSGDRKRLLRSLPAPALLSPHAREILLLLPRPQPDQVPHFRAPILCGAPSPTTPLLAQANLDGIDYVELRLIGRSHEALADYARLWSAFTHQQAGGVNALGTSPDDGFAIDFVMRDPSGLYLHLLFGLHLMI